MMTMTMGNSERFTFRVASSSTSTSVSAFVTFVLVAVTIGGSSGVTTGISAQPVPVPAQNGVVSTLPNLRLFSTSQQLQQHEVASPLVVKNRKVREIARVQTDHGEDDQQDFRSPPVLSTSSKLKGLYPSLSGSGELLRLFRPLAWSPEKTIGINRWYLPGVGYFSRGGRAASSNFIRFGRSDGTSPRFIDDADDGMNGGGDVTMLSRNSAKKKNNFIRLGRENPRQTNFIRLGRSGAPPSQPGEFYNSGYITPSLSDPFRDDEDGRHEYN